MKPSEGDYCRYYQEIIEYYNGGDTICDNCNLRCVYAGDKEERDYLLKKNKQNNGK